VLEWICWRCDYQLQPANKRAENRIAEVGYVEVVRLTCKKHTNKMKKCVSPSKITKEENSKEYFLSAFCYFGVL
jgi:hypothetical protein